MAVSINVHEMGIEASGRKYPSGHVRQASVQLCDSQIEECQGLLPRLYGCDCRFHWYGTCLLDSMFFLNFYSACCVPQGAIVHDEV
jgi:hypothetical protein